MSRVSKTKEKTVYRVKKLTWVHTEYTDGTSEFHRINDGFYSFELLGLIEQVKLEIIDQLKGAIKPTYVKREIVKD